MGGGGNIEYISSKTQKYIPVKFELCYFHQAKLATRLKKLDGYYVVRTHVLAGVNATGQELRSLGTNQGIVQQVVWWRIRRK